MQESPITTTTEVRDHLMECFDRQSPDSLYQSLGHDSFNLRLDPDGPIFTVTVRRGGAMTI